MTPLAMAVLAGLGAGAAVLLAAGAFRSPTIAGRSGRLLLPAAHQARRWAEALVAGLVVLAAARWVVLAVAVGGAVLLRDRIFASSGAQAERAHVEAIALWLEAVRDALRSDASLQQVLYRVAANPPAALALPLGRFERRGRQGVPLTEALALLADEVAHPTADVAVASMVQSLELSGGRVRQQLDELAATARHELSMRERVDRIRARFDVATKAMMALAAVIIGYLWLVGRIATFYRSPSGQLLLALPVGTWVLSLGWMRRLARYELPMRTIVRAAGVVR